MVVQVVGGRLDLSRKIFYIYLLRYIYTEELSSILVVAFMYRAYLANVHTYICVDSEPVNGKLKASFKVALW